MRYCSCHENINFISSSCKPTDDGVIDDFPRTSDHFQKIYEDENSRTFSENFRRLPKFFDDDSTMFRSYTNEFEYKKFTQNRQTVVMVISIEI